MCSGDRDRDLPGVSWAPGESGGVRKEDVLVTKGLAALPSTWTCPESSAGLRNPGEAPTSFGRSPLGLGANSRPGSPQMSLTGGSTVLLGACVLFLLGACGVKCR